jgi:hypothetical protein
MGDGRWEMGDGRWEMGDGRWEAAPSPRPNRGKFQKEMDLARLFHPLDPEE